ncbi:FAD/NAD(P)-binding protein [Gluconacetobacter entanii]|uniref:FAD-dependent urate hydroxylase HpyO/Asp monooxygenase CreE-like FAD/NAD(P)-binding domain-containing protein n=1 Tax=Gluconacetobacter entanii TaxID=108528 RepID=A0A318PPA4_9PROT|nr:FAD-dependent oxidoreductase [Gluconacetobacter entanii]PYD61417.1 hypothetical protein CFR72_14445 [Gluconacetobacter entanii]
MSCAVPVPHVAIIGGGFSGAALAWHLARANMPALRITVFEPRPTLGAGLAYGTTDPHHRVNAPAARMSLDTDNQHDFMDWIIQTGAVAGDDAAWRPDGACFPARAVFGRYVADRLAPLLAGGAITHHRAIVQAAYRRGDNRWVLSCGDGTVTEADIVVIATSHPPPRPPAPLRGLALRPGVHPVLVANPWDHGALDDIRATDRVLVVGTGLSMADAVATLNARGHRGPVLAISRRGQRSRGHAPHKVEAFGAFTTPPARTARAVLRRVRDTLRASAEQPWQAVFDRLREQAADIWAALPLVERRRLIRHLRPFWDTHRFRISPPTEDIMSARHRAGLLEFMAARLTQVTVEGEAFRVTLRHRNGHARPAAFDAIITTTGPAHGDIITAQPFLSGLAAAGMVEMDPTGLGLHVDALGRACVGLRHEATLFVAGPLARGRFGELMGLPEVSRQVARLSAVLRALVAPHAGPAGVAAGASAEPFYGLTTMTPEIP